MASQQVEFVFVDGRLFYGIRLASGVFLVQLKKCQPSPQQKFPSSCAGDALITITDTFLEEFKMSSISIGSSLHEEPCAHLVKHRGGISVKVLFKERSAMYSLALFSPKMIEQLVTVHYEQNNFCPVILKSGSSLLTLNYNYAFLPLTRVDSDLMFLNNFWTEISPMLKLKLDVHFGKVPFFESMVESPLVQSAVPPCKIDTQYYRGAFLGEGTFGKVFEIKKNPWDTPLALKIMNRGSKESFGTFYKSLLSEIAGLELCAPFYDIKIYDPSTFQLFMPFYGKKNLFGYISGKKNTASALSNSTSSSFPSVTAPMLLPEQHLGIFRAVLNVFHKLHKQGMAHLDVKMCNIIGPLEDFSSRLIDFGLCSLQEGPQKEILKTTLDTRDPIIFQGKECFTWSDIWSLGVLFSDLVAEKRFSIIPYREPGFWPNGKKYDWDKEETKLCLKCVEERVNDDECLQSFLSTLLGTKPPSEIKNPNVSIGTAYILSSCLWRNPGKRTSFGLQNTFTGASLSKWPYPVFTSEKLPPVPRLDNFSLCVKEKQRGHFLLDGSGPYQSLIDIPQLSDLRASVQTKKRKFQLQFIAAVLLDLREFNLKTFLLAVDILDRVSNCAVQEHIQKSYEKCLSFVALETASIFFALLQTCPSEPSLESVLQRVLENLPLEYTSIPFQVKDSIPKLWDLLLNLLSTVRFQQSWKDSLWNEIVTMKKFHSSTFLKGVLEGLLSWPDSIKSTEEFLSGIVSNSTLTTSLLGALIPLKKTNLEESWLTPEFQSLVSSSPFLDVFLYTSKAEKKLLFPPLPPSPPLTSVPEIPPTKKTFDMYLETFLHAKTHPFWIPFPNSKIPEISRAEFVEAVETYTKNISSHIPIEVLQGKQCIVCNKPSSHPCLSCEQWSLCLECGEFWKGRCTQCLFPHEHEDWKKKSVFV